MIDGAWLRCQREALGLNVTAAANLLDTSTYMLQQWENGSHPIPSALPKKFARIHAETIKALELLTRDPDSPIVVYRSNHVMWDHHPQWKKFPATWFRVVAAKAAAITGAPIRYWTP